MQSDMTAGSAPGIPRQRASIESVIGELEHRLRKMSSRDYMALAIGPVVGGLGALYHGLRTWGKASAWRYLLTGAVIGAAVPGGFYYKRWKTLKSNWLLVFESLRLKRTGYPVYEGGDRARRRLGLSPRHLIRRASLAAASMAAPVRRLGGSRPSQSSRSRA
jgi:hypothetical protein